MASSLCQLSHICFVAYLRAAPTAVAQFARLVNAVTEDTGKYDDAVRCPAKAAALNRGAELVRTACWPATRSWPCWLVDGYSTLFAEIYDQSRGGRRRGSFPRWLRFGGSRCAGPSAHPLPEPAALRRDIL